MIKRNLEWHEGPLREGAGPHPGSVFRTWEPLLLLTPPTRNNPVKLANIELLLHELRTGEQARLNEYSLASYLSPPGLRRSIALRAGRPELAFEELNANATELNENWKVVSSKVSRFKKLRTIEQGWLLALLGQLTLYPLAVGLIGGMSLDTDGTAGAFCAYEAARAVQRISINHPLPQTIFEAIIEGHADVHLRIASGIQLMVRGSRYQRDEALAKQSMEWSEGLLKREYAVQRSPRKFALMASRFFRSAALVHIRFGSFHDATAALGYSRLWHEELVKLAGQSVGMGQLALENRRLVVEAELKAATQARDPKGAKQALELPEIDGNDPDCLAFAAEYWLVMGDWRRANALFLRAVRRGTLRAVLSAVRAADIYVEQGRPTRAHRAYRLAFQLDPRCKSAQLSMDDIASAAGERVYAPAVRAPQGPLALGPIHGR